MQPQWWIEPLLLIIFTFLATQFGTTFARKMLDSHSENLNPRNNQDLKDAIQKRAELANQPAGRALDSYLNQIVATWGLVLLIIGQGIVLWTHHRLFRDYAFWAIIGTLVLVIVIVTWRFLGRESLMPYFDAQSPKPSKIPPFKTLLTWLRIIFFVIYAVLVIVAFKVN